MTEQEYGKKGDEILLNYLNSSTPLDWHKMALDWNYDNGDTFFKFLLANPMADRGTMLMIYWMLTPRWLNRYANRAEVEKIADWELDDFDFLTELEAKLLNGFFKNANYAYNPKSDHYGYDWTTEYLDEKVKRELPAELFNFIEGELIEYPTDYIEGFPPKVWDLLEKLDEEYEGDK